MDDILRLLTRAYDRLDAGHCKNALHLKDGDAEMFCASGAVICEDSISLSPPRITNVVFQSLYGVMTDAERARAMEYTKGRWHPLNEIFHVIYFNNHPDTTKEDVLALFKRAIKKHSKEVVIETAVEVTDCLVLA